MFNCGRLQLRKIMTMSADLSTFSRTPIVVILGSTGTGKSKLAVDLALRFNAEVISADSMQVYKGLDILTNKITESETRGVPHHMISAVDPLIKFDVVQFRNTVLPIVERIQQENKVPIIVGGTNYYIESLVWKILIDKKQDKSVQPKKRLKLEESGEPLSTTTHEIIDLLDSCDGNLTYDEFERWTSNELHGTLEVVDPNRAKRLHPNDRRKVIRSLAIFFQTGKTHSEHIQVQLQEPNMALDHPAMDSDDENTPATNTTSSLNPLGGSMRFSNIVCLWIQAPMDILEKRIRQRVDEMVEKGLRDELNNYMEFVGHGTRMDFTEGVLQSIGFKEFESYLKLTQEEKCTEKGDKCFNEGVERQKIVTRQYAKKQVQWINRRFLQSSRRKVPPVYWLDGSNTEAAEWEANVTSVGIQIVDCYVTGDQLDDEILTERRVHEPEKSFEGDLTIRICELCDNRILTGTEQWEKHIRSNKHRYMARQKRQIMDLDYRQKDEQISTELPIVQNEVQQQLKTN